MMSSNFWYLDRNRAQLGPVGEDEFVRLITQGAITRETLMWTAGMGEWRMAGEVPAVSPLFGPTSVAVRASMPASGPAIGPLHAAIPVWGLVWRSVLVFLGDLLIIPAPWASTWFYKWLCERVSLPDGRPLTFSGRAGDIWYVFIAWSVLPMIGGQFGWYSVPVTILLWWIFTVMVLKWFCAHASTADGSLKLSFEGGYLPYIGWNILLLLSVFTIVGGAWVMKYMLRWICRNIRGTAEFAFTGTGLAILWRGLVFALLSILIIPIPWMARWYMRWMISQVAVVRADS